MPITHKNPNPNPLQYANMQRIAQCRERYETNWKTDPSKLDLTWYFTAINRLESWETLAPGGYADRCQHLINSLLENTHPFLNPDDISNLHTDITDAWNCNLISDSTCESASENLTEVLDKYNNPYLISLGLIPDPSEE